MTPPQGRKTALQSAALWVSGGPFVRRGADLFKRNSADVNLPLSKFEKLITGGWLILRDYGNGVFPPTYSDRERTFAAEVEYGLALPGMTAPQFLDSVMRKPFWDSHRYFEHSKDYARLLKIVERVTTQSERSLLELGCGSGWMAEFFAMAGYPVVGTSISPADIALGDRRVAALRAKGLQADIAFKVSPMETVREAFDDPAFDVVYVYEALHHAFDWQQAIRSAYQCLRPGGWLILANEPNEAHTFVAYRGARITNTHEIGFRQRDLKSAIRDVGFKSLRILSPRVNNLFSPHWLVASK